LGEVTVHCFSENTWCAVVIIQHELSTGILTPDFASQKQLRGLFLASVRPRKNILIIVEYPDLSRYRSEGGLRS
jgi:hypothetical protein